MDLSLTMRQTNSESVEELHYVLTVTNPSWNRNLPSGAMLQTYVQMLHHLDFVIDGITKYENFV